MSHVMKADLEVRDIESLANAVTALGGQFAWGEQLHRYFGGQMSKCDHVIRVPGSDYEIGVIEDKATGAFSLAYDPWVSPRNLLESKFGAGLRTLKQHYTANAAATKLRASGFRELSRVVDEAGLLRIKLGR